MQLAPLHRRGASWPGLLALALVPLLANWPAVSGWLTVDPIYGLSGLGTGLAAGPLPGVTSLDPNIGITTQALGRLAATDWLAGRIPWWNPYSGVGLPLAAEGQNQALFLPFVLLLALRDGPLLLLIAMQEVAAFSTYALLRQMALGRAAAWTGGALFAINGTFAWFGHGPAMPVAFAPLLLLGIEMEFRTILAARDRPVRRGAGWVVAAVAVAFSLYAGFPETAYIDGLFGGAWALLRFAQCGQGWRLAFAGRVGAAAVAGMLLAAPYIVPFLHLLSVAELGMHAQGIGGIAAPLAVLPVLMMPHVLGAQSFGAHDPSGVLVWLWSFVGGYVSLPVLALASVAVLLRGPDRGLRLMLAGWCVLMIGATFGVPGIKHLVYAVPGLSLAQVYRYSPPSWQLAATVLAAMAVNDWQRGAIGRKRAVVALVAVFGLAAAALAAARQPISYLLGSTGQYQSWLLLSVAAAGTFSLGAAALLAARSSTARAGLLALVLLVDGIGLFSVPRLAGFRRAALDMSAVDFLRGQGLHRFYTLGPLAPNYPASFGLASVNSDYLPTPRLWTEHIRTALDVFTDANAFTGAFQWPGLAPVDHMAEFAARLPAYRGLGVRFVLVPAGRRFGGSLLGLPPGPATDPFALRPGERMEVLLPEGMVAPGIVEDVSVTIGTYLGAADGTLAVRLCTADGCSGAVGELAGAADNAPLEMRLDAPLAVAPGQQVRVRIAHDGGTAAVAVWRYPKGLGDEALPALTLGQAPAIPVRRVFSNAILVIYEVADPAPYFEAAGGPCRVVPLGRETARAECDAPGRLIRRELFFEGWRATVNGRAVPVGLAEPIFQAVDLPAGASAIRFRYAPPYAEASAVAFGLGMLAVALGLAVSRRDRRSGRGGSTPSSCRPGPGRPG